jgi:hypothetical protein
MARPRGPYYGMPRDLKRGIQRMLAPPYPGRDPIERICNYLAPIVRVDAHVSTFPGAGPGRPSLVRPCVDGRFYCLFVDADGSGVLTDLTALEEVWTFQGPEPVLYPLLPWVEILRERTGANVSTLTRLLCACGVPLSINSVWRFCQKMDAAAATKTPLTPSEVKVWRARLRTARNVRPNNRSRDWLTSHREWRIQYQERHHASASV